MRYLLLFFTLLFTNSITYAASCVYAYGNYIGNGNATKAITGISFTPEAILVKPVGNYGAWITTNTMAAGYAKLLSSTAAVTTGYISSIDAGGFTVGTSANVNNVLYQYVVFDETTDFNIGSFTGNAVTATDHSGLTSGQPEVLWIFPENATGSTFTQANRSPLDGYWTDGSDGSQHAMWAWSGTGFTAGTVQNANTIVYHFIAMDASADANIEEGIYVGDGTDDKSVTPLGGGFTPTVALTFTHATAGPPSLKTAAMTSNNAFKLGSATGVETDLIKTFVAGGVTLGTDGATNPSANFNSLLGFSNGTSLPVELTSFEAHKYESDVSLTWETATEVNSDHFEIMHSTDGENFSSIGTVAAQGNSNHFIRYDFTHEKPGNGIHYYQLVEYDADGAFEKFKTIIVNMNDDLEMITQLFPNPTKSYTSLYFNSSVGGCYFITINDLSGKEVYSAKIGTMIGENLFKISMVEFAEGTYNVNLRAPGGSVSSIKVVKIN